MKKLSIRLRTLTPLFTGGIRGTADCLHETGIVGSMRWWYESIIRGLRGVACNPTDHICPDKNNCLCDVCTVFGATGWKRTFRIDWDNQKNDPDAVNRPLIVGVNNNRRWFLKHGLYLDNLLGDLFQLRSAFRGSEKADLLQSLALTLHLIEKWGALGAKSSNGYGVIEIINLHPELDLEKSLSFFSELIARSEPKRISRGIKFPNLSQFFFAKVRFRLPPSTLPDFFIRSHVPGIVYGDELDWFLHEDSSLGKQVILPTAPLIRYHLRRLISQNILYRGNSNAPARWKLMGVISGKYHSSDLGKIQRSTCLTCGNNTTAIRAEIRSVQRIQSKIRISHAYPINKDEYEFRLWGWIPSSLEGGVSTSSILRNLKTWLGLFTTPARGGWIPVTGGLLWGRNHCNLLQNNLQIAWMEKLPEESGEDYLRALLLWE